MADDAIKPAVVAALLKDGWTVTHDPFTLDYEDITVLVDLAGERLLAAERGVERIAVEVKTFRASSPVRDFRDALGQYDIYRMILEDLQPERKLYVAVSEAGYERVFTLQAVARFMAKRPMPVVVVRPEAEEVVRWIG